MATSLVNSTSILRAIAVCLTLFSHLAAAQNGDGGAASGNLPSTAANGNAAGASGSSQSSANLSTGATVAIAVVVAIMVIFGILTAILFWQAKKRQWTVRETLRRSTKRVTTGLKGLATPLTATRMTFSPKSRSRFDDDEDTMKLRSNPSAGADAPPSFSRRNRDGDNPYQQMTDLEKGPSYTVTSAAGAGVGHTREPSRTRPKAPMIRIPSSSKRLEPSPQTPLWTKMIGRK